jgi:hypothetical protein
MNKGLFIGINYIGTPNALGGCINDVNNVFTYLNQKYNLNSQNCMFLTDLTPIKPTVQNIINSFGWLISNVKVGDSLFFHYSGHGTQIRDRDGDEKDRLDESIVPLDFMTKGIITDDIIFSLLVLRVPKGVNLFCILDCCNSGTGMDLKYTYLNIGNRDTLDMVGRRNNILGNVVMLSGCRDNQTSADTYEINFYTKQLQQQGALTYGFLEIINKFPTINYANFIKEIRKILQLKKYTQIPQLSFGTYPNLLNNVKLL